MGKINWRGLWGRTSRAIEFERGDQPRNVSVDTALIIEAARHVVTTRVATRASLVRHLQVAPTVADQLLARLEHCEVIASAAPGQAHRVLSTSGELPGIIDEFRHREHCDAQ
ncbi:hypothetical protein DEJ30_08085 [Curtobacterium sp. MCPF17_003]|uniref:hypothetical protein n=1 Tax=Curtobacterium sp. MCPF17_003 TaxID=2175637 RepID=UPI000D8C0FCC|nr:hypothetical protein [Curtobacterium sp. MCPF17_003]PYY64414.1 hypothetical protein DEJ30_08085 [Curtobacterium sp. MCPF17_003]